MGGITVRRGILCRNQFFPETLNTVLSHNPAEAQSEKNPAVMMVHAKSDSTPLAASAGWDGGEPEVQRTMEGAFPELNLAIKLRGTTLEALGITLFTPAS